MRAVAVLRRDCPPGRRGFVAGMAGPALAVGLVTLVASLLGRTGAGNEGLVLIFGIDAIMVVGFQLFVGNTGIMSFGHVAFMALGAYAAGIVSLTAGLRSTVLPSLPRWAAAHFGMLPSLLLGGAVAAVVALLVGAIILRLSGAAASIATLGLLLITNEVLSNASDFTRGPQSFFGVPQTTNFAWVFVTLVVVVLISAAFKWSRAGLRSRAVRDSAVAAETSGVQRMPARLWAFTLSALITGFGGALYAHYLGAFSPQTFYITAVIIVIVMAIIGGVDSITGALVGSALVSVLNWLLLELENGTTVGPVHIPPLSDISQLVLGLVLVGVLRWRRSGLFGSLELQVASGRGHTGPRGGEQPGNGRRRRLGPLAPAETRVPSRCAPVDVGGSVMEADVLKGGPRQT